METLSETLADLDIFEGEEIELSQTNTANNKLLYWGFRWQKHNKLKEVSKMVRDELQLKIKNVYGMDRIYPACRKSQRLADLKGSKTFSVEDVKLIKEELEFKITFMPQELIDLGLAQNKLDHV